MLTVWWNEFASYCSSGFVGNPLFYLLLTENSVSGFFTIKYVVGHIFSMPKQASLSFLGNGRGVGICRQIQLGRSCKWRCKTALDQFYIIEVKRMALTLPYKM
jgi:hypothetical protein